MDNNCNNSNYPGVHTQERVERVTEQASEEGSATEAHTTGKKTVPDSQVSVSRKRSRNQNQCNDSVTRLLGIELKVSILSKTMILKTKITPISTYLGVMY